MTIFYVHRLFVYYCLLLIEYGQNRVITMSVMSKWPGVWPDLILDMGHFGYPDHSVWALAQLICGHRLMPRGKLDQIFLAQNRPLNFH